MDFKLESNFKPSGDQVTAIDSLVKGLENKNKYQTLLGVTASGKTFTIANVIEKANRPTLVMSHNKTLAAQLYRELKDFFPNNAVEYFVSYYDYYQPEAYVPAKDLYIDKDASVNDEIDRLRLKATTSLLERRDVIIVASVSCIYGLGSPEDYRKLYIAIEKDGEYDRDEIIEKLVSIQYERVKDVLERARFKVIGDTIEIMSAYSDEVIRVEFFGDTVERIIKINPITRQKLAEQDRVVIYPAKHFVTGGDKLAAGIKLIEEELEEQYNKFKSEGKLVEAERIYGRTKYDLEMLREVGYCAGIENYSRPLSGRKEGDRPACLIDYFPDDFLTIIDESHVSVPQIRGMFFGDRSRKETLVKYGFRLPSALDNRPLYFEEFEKLTHDTIYISATPAEYELKKSSQVVEQIIRPTGLLDPIIEVYPIDGQIDRILEEIKKTVSNNERIFITTLTKKMAEDLTKYLNENGVRTRYLHSDIQTVERVEIIRDLRLGAFDVLVGVNLLREGLDIPEGSFLDKLTWFNPLEEPMMMLGLSMVMGFVHIMFALGLKAARLIKEKDFQGALGEVFSWYLIFGGLIVYVLSSMVFKINVLGTVGLAILILGLAVLLIFGGHGKKGVKRVIGGVGKLYDTVNFMSDILSYSRLFGLGLATGVIGMVINKIVEVIIGLIPVAGYVLGAAFFVLGHVMNIAINTLGTYVHNCRLQYIEFFGKFYDGGGKLFTPIGSETKYTYIER